MKRFIMPLTAFLVVGTILFTGCDNKDEVPEQEPPVVDTLTPPANVDTLVVDTAGTGTEVKVVDGDSAKPTTSGRKGGTKTQSKGTEMETSSDGKTGTKKPQDNTNTNTPTSNEPVQKNDAPTNTRAKKPQQP